MKCAPNVVHLSKSPLVGAPAKLAGALCSYTNYDSVSIISSDYPKHLKGLFSTNSIQFTEKEPIYSICTDLIKCADIIHIHNDISQSLRKIVIEQSKVTCKFVYQVHSPLREGPLFFDRVDALGFDFSKKLVINHFHPRIFQNYQLVPNLISNKPSLKLLADNEKIKIIFSPAHERTGLRWNDKISRSQNKVLDGVVSLGLADVVTVNGMNPYALGFLRKSTHITIDEIITGSFHQVSLEGLAYGNAVINNADYFSTMTLKSVCNTADNPPFIRMDESSFASKMIDLLNDRDRIRNIQREGYEYFTQYLHPSKLVRIFSDIYDEVLDV